MEIVERLGVTEVGLVEQEVGIVEQEEWMEPLLAEPLGVRADGEEDGRRRGGRRQAEREASWRKKSRCPSVAW